MSNNNLIHKALKALAHDLEQASLAQSRLVGIKAHGDGSLTANVEAFHADGSECRCASSEYRRHHLASRTARGHVLTCGGFVGKLFYSPTEMEKESLTPISKALSALLLDLERATDLTRSRLVSANVHRDGGLTAYVEAFHADGSTCRCPSSAEGAHGQVLNCGGFVGLLFYSPEGRTEL